MRTWNLSESSENPSRRSMRRKRSGDTPSMSEICNCLGCSTPNCSGVLTPTPAFWASGRTRPCRLQALRWSPPRTTRPRCPGAWSRMTSRSSRLIRSVTSGRRLRPSPPRPRKPRWRRSSELRWNTRSCRPSSNWRRPSRPVRRKSMRERETCLDSSASVTATSNRGFQNPPPCMKRPIPRPISFRLTWSRWAPWPISTDRAASRCTSPANPSTSPDVSWPRLSRFPQRRFGSCRPAWEALSGVSSAKIPWDISHP